MDITIMTATRKGLRIPEIVLAIVSFIWRYNTSELQHQLYSLILVCKDLHQICTPLLWRNLSLQGGAFQSSKPFPFWMQSKYTLLEPYTKPSPRRQQLVVCWFKQGLRKYGSFVRSIDWDELREGRHSHRFPMRASEEVRMGLKRSRLLSLASRGAEGTTEDADAGESDLLAYNFDDDADDDDMEDKLLNSETLPKDDGGVKFRTWILKFCPNLEHVTIRHLRAGMDIYRPFFVEAAKRTMLSSIKIVVIDRDNDFSYSGCTLADFLESLSGIMDNNDSAEFNINKSICNTDTSTTAATDIARDIALSKGIVGTRSGRLLNLSINDYTYYEGGYEHAQKFTWSHITDMLDTHPNLQSLALYNFIFFGDFVTSSSYPAMRDVQVDFDCFNEVDLPPFLSLFPNLTSLSCVVPRMSVKRTLVLLHKHCPRLSDLVLRLAGIDNAERPEVAVFISEFQHSMPHLRRLTLKGDYKYHWVAPNVAYRNSS